MKHKCTYCNGDLTSRHDIQDCIEALKQQRDGLLEACKRLMSIAELAEFYAPGEMAERPELTREIIETAQAAIAKARGES